MRLVLKMYSHLYGIFFFCIWIGNESEDHFSPDLVRIRQSGRVGYGVTIGFLQGAIDFIACYMGQRMDPSHSLGSLGLVECFR